MSQVGNNEWETFYFSKSHFGWFSWCMRYWTNWLMWWTNWSFLMRSFLIFDEFKICETSFKLIMLIVIPFQILNFISLLDSNHNYSSITKTIENLFIMRIACQFINKSLNLLNTVEMDSDLMSFEIFLNFMWNFLELLI